MNPPVETPNPDTLFSIELTNGAQSIRDLYFKEGRGSLFTFKGTRILLQLTLAAILFSAIFYFLSFSSDQVSLVVIFVLANLAALTFLLGFVRNAIKYLKWKKAVNNMIKKAGSYRKVLLNVKSAGFEAIYDEQVVIEKWSNFQRATIEPTHIYLSQEGASYFFPARSMQPAEYEALAQTVRSNVASDRTGKEGSK